ncbi:BtrH N-terminal domain-containing protein [Jidongwangia harbinensis]|uniref:BtrH N-terminal domain-containing protein n=1 Tax=Jidongwangia harbinensis TaxID=2878561 RepID=UPI001CD9E5B6|nr:BtrH N-terminal domain-containing protein [Jidongwangia harbinensis]MCA2211335.1 BtrH N-terminal domain-containing protein [Jidongwangia harbinensis]
MILEEIDGFADTYLDCVTNTYTRQLRHAGLWPLVLGDDWGHWYSPGLEPWPLAGWWGVGRPPEQALTDWYGIAPRLTRHRSAAQVWAHVDRVLADGRLPAVVLDVHHYPRSPYAGRHHYPHRVVIAARDDATALVLDGSGPGRVAARFPLTTLETAMAEPELADGAWGYDARRLTIDLPDPDPDRRDLPDAALRARLDANVRRYRAGTGLAGPAAVERFHDDLAAYLGGPEPAGDLLPAGVVTFGTLTTGRKLNAMFVAHAGDRLGIDLTTVATQLHTSAYRWNVLLHRFMLGHRQGQPVGALVRGFVPRLRQITDLETAAFEELHRRMR